MDEIEAAYTERDMTRSPPARSGTLSVKLRQNGKRNIRSLTCCARLYWRSRAATRISSSVRLRHKRTLPDHSETNP
jgi:hypothetical protein